MSAPGIGGADDADPLCVEEQLALDAEERGWGREVERHQRIAERISSLLDDLGEPHADLPEESPQE